MKPGEYIGKDGRTWMVTHLILLEKLRATTKRVDGDGTLYGTGSILHVTMDHPDWPAAKAALDALIEEEQFRSFDRLFPGAR